MLVSNKRALNIHNARMRPCCEQCSQALTQNKRGKSIKISKANPEPTLISFAHLLPKGKQKLFHQRGYVMSIPILDLALARDADQRGLLLDQLRAALFDVGFLYIINHGVPEDTISTLIGKLPALFDLPDKIKLELSKIHSPHFLGYSGVAEETTLGKSDLREQFDFATELPVVYRRQGKGHDSARDFSKLYWRLRGPNQWPTEEDVPGFQEALLNYLDALSELSYSFVHLVEEAFDIPIGTFDSFFRGRTDQLEPDTTCKPEQLRKLSSSFLCPQHRIKLIKYQVVEDGRGQGVGAHKDSSGWLTFLYQVGEEHGLEVLDRDGAWIAARPMPGSFVVNFGNAFEAATEGAVRATVHRVKAPTARNRYSVPFFMGLPLDLSVSEIRSLMPAAVRAMRSKEASETEDAVSAFLDARWDSLGESQLRKWLRSHRSVGLKWYGEEVVEYYTH